MTALICCIVVIILGFSAGLLLTKTWQKVSIGFTILLAGFTIFTIFSSIDINNNVFEKREVQIIPLYSAKTEVYLYNTNGIYVYYTKDDYTKKLSRYSVSSRQGDIYVYEDGFKELRIVTDSYKYPEWLLQANHEKIYFEFHVPEHSVMEGFKFE